MVQAINQGINVKTRLTVDIVGALLLRNFTPAQIARTCNVTDSSVSRFIKRNYEKLLPHVDKNDSLLIAKSKNIVNKGFDRINNILDDNNFSKKDLPSLSIATGTMFDKMRILQNKSTGNLQIDALHSRRADRRQRREELLKELSTVRNEPKP